MQQHQHETLWQLPVAMSCLYSVCGALPWQGFLSTVSGPDQQGQNSCTLACCKQKVSMLQLQVPYGILG